MRERPLASIPKPVLLLAALGLLLQIAWHALQPPPQAQAQDLSVPLNRSAWNIAAMGDPVTLSRWVILWLQTFDNQPGISLPFMQLDYAKVSAWLETALQLDPHSQYPLLAAARLYGEVADEPRQRIMLEFIYQKFLEHPDLRWPWLAHAALVAKHRLNDLPLALKFSQAIADKTDSSAVPSWARQMQIFILEDMGELESARLLLGGLLHSGTITDAHELRFLNERLETLQRRQTESPARVP